MDERTSLFAENRPSTSYATPGRYSREHYHQQFIQFQCCICSSFFLVLIVALIITISYAVSTDDNAKLPDSNVTENIIPPSALNGTMFLNLMTSMEWPINDEPPVEWLLPPPTVLDKDLAVNAGIGALGSRELFEENIQSLPSNSPSYKHQRAISTTPDARKLSKRGYVENQATLALARKYSFKKPDGRCNIGNGPILNLEAFNQSVEVCNFNSKYRTSNGICNNKEHPFVYGVAFRPFRRQMNPDYSDGIWKPRASHTKHPLPSARKVSLSVHPPSYSIDPHFTVMLAVFGQFLDHDITATALNQGQDGEPIDCCNSIDGNHPECFPVSLEEGDPNYDQYNISCMNFIRSAPAPNNHFGPRQQLNQASAFIDGSVVYGSTDKKIISLRTNKDGLLRMFLTSDNRTLLPVSTDPTDGCNEQEKNAKGRYCFESGDARANENLHLTAMHLLWARHHNYLATNLQKLNPHWNDDKLFLEARRILGAQLQHITYNEFLPILLGQNYSDEMKISPKTHGNSDTYNKNVDSSISNVFAACAFRFAHTLIPGLMNATRDLNNPDAIELHKMLFNPYSLWSNDGLDNAIGGAIRTPLARSDQYFTTELTEKLFINPNKDKANMIKGCGLDLVSLNIQRGRDHGLPAYNEWRKFCKLPSVQTWDDLALAVDAESLKSMKAIYRDVENIDVYTGALSEPPLEGSIVGPLLSCLITDQFLRLKKGDSHWYEREIGLQRFTKAQLNEIYSTTLASIICRNSDDVKQTQRFVMRKFSSDNQMEICSVIDTFSLEPWKEINNNPNMTSVKVPSEQSSIRKIVNNTIE